MESDMEEEIKVEVKEEVESSSEEGEKTSSKKIKMSKTNGRPDLTMKTKISKPGIIYLSTIPPGMNVKQIREYFTEFGDIHRSYLQPDKKPWKGKKKNQTFTEGWIEFRKRRHARGVAAELNNTPVGGKKRKIYHDFIWNIKYLQGFQWVHLNERLAYERISRKQRERTDIAAVKREVSFFAKSVDLSKTLKKKGILDKDSPIMGSSEANPGSKSTSKPPISKLVTRPEPPKKTNDKNTTSDSTDVMSERMKFFKRVFS